MRSVDGAWRLPACAVGLTSPKLYCVCSGRDEETREELSAHAEEPGASPQEDVQRPLAPGRVLGGFAKRKTPKVSEPVGGSFRPPGTLQFLAGRILFCYIALTIESARLIEFFGICMGALETEIQRRTGKNFWDKPCGVPGCPC